VDGRVEIALLGPVECRVDGSLVDLAGASQRTVLARLALNLGQVVSTRALVEVLWAGDPPTNAPGNVRSYLSRLRRAIGADVVERHAGGYRLALDPGQLDITRVQRLAADGRALAGRDPSRAAAAIGEALALWRGEPLADLRDQLAFEPEITRLAALRTELEEEWYALRVAAGDGLTVIPELERAVRTHPTRERFHLTLMHALHQVGRTAEALRVGTRLRRYLVETSGTDPSPALGELEWRILNEDPSLRASVVTSRPARRWAPDDRFVGRDAELAELGKAAASPGLVTVVGPGGVGKSRLVLELLDRNPPSGPVYLVALADVLAGEMVARHVAGALGLHGATGDPIDAIAGLLGNTPTTLVLDDCEQVAAASAALIAELRRRCQRLVVVATSRQRLGAPGERVLRLGPLPDGERATLFLDRATRLRPGFDADAYAADVVAVCHLVDGLPLAVELAARREAVFGIAQLREHLAAGLEVLESTHPGGRHDSVATTVEWSYRLLEPHAQVLFDRLAVCREGFPLDAVEHLAPPSRHAPPVLLAELVEASLVVADVTADPPRYRLLEPMRQVGLGHLHDRGRNAAETAHTGWALHLATQLCRSCIQRAPAAAALLHREAANLRAALERLAAHRDWRRAGQLGTTVAMAILDTPRLDLLGPLHTLEAADSVDPVDRGRCALAAGAARWVQGTRVSAAALIEEALSLLPADDPVRWLARLVHLSLGMPQGERAVMADDVEALRAEPATPAWALATGVCSAALASLYHGDPEYAAAQLRAEEDLLERVAAVDGIVAYTRGELAAASNPAKALRWYEDAHRRCDQAGHVYNREVAGIGRAAVLIRLGRTADAARACDPLLDELRGLGMWPQVWIVLRLVAELLLAVEDAAPAAALLAAADADPSAPPVTGPDAVRREAGWRRAAELLGQENLERARRAGLADGRAGAVERARAALAALR
jgi:predicted ATPase/DNA-binding SARP family transcriptional activator